MRLEEEPEEDVDGDVEVEVVTSKCDPGNAARSTDGKMDRDRS